MSVEQPCVRLDNRNHAAIRLRNDLFVLARRFRKHRWTLARFEDGLGMAKDDPLDRAFCDPDAIVFLQLDRHLGEGLIGGKIGDRPLQGPRTTPRRNFGALPERTHPYRFQPVLRLPDRDFAEFRVPAKFFLPWRCI